jgi:hypothetical protein
VRPRFAPPAVIASASARHRERQAGSGTMPAAASVHAQTLEHAACRILGLRSRRDDRIASCRPWHRREPDACTFGGAFGLIHSWRRCGPTRLVAARRDRDPSAPSWLDPGPSGSQAGVTPSVWIRSAGSDAARCTSPRSRRSRASRRLAGATSLQCLTSRDLAIPPTPLVYGVFAPVTIA